MNMPAKTELIIDIADLDGNWDRMAMTIVNMAFQRGMPEGHRRFEKGDKLAALEEDFEYFTDALPTLANDAQNWLTDYVAPRGYSFNVRTSGFWIQPSN